MPKEMRQVRARGAGTGTPPRPAPRQGSRTPHRGYSSSLLLPVVWCAGGLLRARRHAPCARPECTHQRRGRRSLEGGAAGAAATRIRGPEAGARCAYGWWRSV